MNKIRSQFPILEKNITGQPLIYFDNAATTQRPKSVIDAINTFNSEENANVHRGIYKLAALATQKYENVREKVRAFINAKYAHEIIFVRGATEALNLVAQSFGGSNLKNGDEVVISTMEHHSNIVPWQIICEKTGAKLQVVKISEAGELDFDHYEKLLNSRTKIVAIMHVSNTLGTINPIKKIIDTAHTQNIPVLVDGAQAAPHLQIDVQDLDCEFYCFSGHKMYGPTGVGILYGKENFLNAMPPYQSGGDMIKRVTFEKTEYADLPQKFEAGTQNFAGIIAFGATIDFLNSIGMAALDQHEQKLLAYATAALSTIQGLKIIGTAKEKVSVISFTLDKIHPHDVATILDSSGIAVRAGHHCTMPLMDFYRVPSTTRISLGIYNNTQEIDTLVQAIQKVKQLFNPKI